MSPSITDIEVFDRVVISGYCHSEGRFFYRLRCTIATHSAMIYDNEIKVWPHEMIGDGKLWFNLRTLRIHKHQR